MKTLTLPVVLLLTVALLFPASQAQAGKWYQNGWVIGGTGLLVGTVIGATVVDSHHRSRHAPRTHYHHHQQPVYRYHQPAQPVYVVQEPQYHTPHSPRFVTTSYVEETRVWPFYRKTRVYPVIRRASYDQEAVSMAWRLRSDWDQRHGGGETTSQQSRSGVEINVGDNNQNVSINVTTNDRQERREVRYQTVTIPNDATGRTSRMVDVHVPVEEETGSEDEESERLHDNQVETDEVDE